MPESDQKKVLSTIRKVALVTGASRGIGAACARSLAAAGYAIAIHYRSDPALAQSLCSELPDAQIFQCDLSDAAACAVLIKEVKKAFGRIDVLVNNAGRSIDQMITFAKVDDFQSLINTNLLPVFVLSKAVSRIMIKQKSGVIVNMSSVVGHTGNGGQSMYSATKAAITGFTRSIAVDLAGFGVRCNCVAPGFIKSEMTDALDEQVKSEITNRIPLGRMGNVEEVGDVVTFLASEQASYITGSTIHVNGGMNRS